MSGFRKFKEKFPSKNKFYSFLTDKKIRNKEYEHVLKIWNNFEMKTMKNYHNLYLKCDVLLSTDMLEKFRNNSLEKLWIMSESLLECIHVQN